jgi:hypothetical protein
LNKNNLSSKLKLALNHVDCEFGSLFNKINYMIAEPTRSKMSFDDAILGVKILLQEHENYIDVSEIKNKMAFHLTSKIHQHHLPGSYFDEDDVLEYINSFYDAQKYYKELEKIKEREQELLEKIKNI